jgi:hypothetical protein
MRYVIERTETGIWTVNVYNDAGQVGAQVLCTNASQAMDVFLMLSGIHTLADARIEYQEPTQKVGAA